MALKWDECIILGTNVNFVGTNVYFNRTNGHFNGMIVLWQKIFDFCHCFVGPSAVNEPANEPEGSQGQGSPSQHSQEDFWGIYIFPKSQFNSQFNSWDDSRTIRWTIGTNVVESRTNVCKIGTNVYFQNWPSLALRKQTGLGGKWSTVFLGEM